MSQARSFALNAPVPVLVIEAASAQGYTANEAATRWDPTRHWSEENWQAFAAAVSRDFAAGASEGSLSGTGVGWLCVAEESCLLVWLRAVSERPSASRHARTLVTEERTRSEQVASMALEYAGFGVWTLDLVTGKRTWDDQMIRLRGYDPATAPDIEEIRRKSTMPEGRRALDASMARLSELAFADPASPAPLLPAIDYEVVWPDGTRRWLRVNGYVVRKQGKNPYAIGLHWDITEAKQIEDLKRQSAVADERANAISQALATVSHEIRTPLNAILGLSRRLLRKSGVPGSLEDVSKIESSARHMLGLVNDILDLARIEAGRLELDASPFNLRELASYAAEMVRHTDSPGASNVTVNIGDSVDEFYKGDALRLSQVLVNLLTNAAKFSPPSGLVRFDIAMAREAPASHLLTFAVTDFGPGMTRAQVDRLFQPFEQVGTVSQQKNGTGLGLAISRRLVRAMGGDIEVCSAPGRGSTFTFSIPLEKWSSPAFDQPAFQLSAGGVDLTGCTVLIVDDNEIGRELAAEVVSEAGARTISASNSKEALDLLGRIGVSVVVMDCEMPEMNGYALTQAIRLDPRWHDIPIIGLSGHTGQAGRDKAIQAGMDDYLSKPFEPASLLDAIRWWSKADET